MITNLRVVTILFILLLVNGCGSDDSGPAKVANLVVTTQVSTDGSGKVDIIAAADNAEFFKFFFGDVTNEIPVTQDFMSISHTYEESGTYTITVQAHSTETDFISESTGVTVNVFITIPATGYTTPTAYAGMNLIWSDEFSGTTVNTDKWVFETGDGCPNVCGWGNNELEYYKSDNASIVEGKLMIEAKSETAGSRSYTSARMITKGKFDFKYGRVDARAALPKGQGIWPAIWMLGSNINDPGVGWPKCGEIDIMEMIGGGVGRDNKVYGTAHWDNAGAYANYGGNHTLSSGIFNDEFHVFSITWDANYIRWYMDDIKYHEILITPSGLSEFQEKFFLILNVAVGGNWPGNPDNVTKFPQRMFVDYIRVFQNQ